MYFKLLGALFILTGGALFRRLLAAPRASRCKALAELSRALSYLACGVEEKRMPMPRLLRSRGFGTAADAFLERVYEDTFKREQALEESWEEALLSLPLQGCEREELLSLTALFSASAPELAAALRACAAYLHDRAILAQGEKKEWEKTEGALCLCAALLLTIVLF